MIVVRPAVAKLPAVVWLSPNRALDRRKMRWLMAALIGVNVAIAAFGLWQGNVFAPLYALLESLAVVAALRLVWRAGDRGERLCLAQDELEVRFLPGDRRMSFQRYWVRVAMVPGHGRQRLLLRSHGRELEIGAFLAETERVELSKELSALLADAR